MNDPSQMPCRLLGRKPPIPCRRPEKEVPLSVCPFPLDDASTLFLPDDE
jgi:hypothetical protein